MATDMGTDTTTLATDRECVEIEAKARAATVMHWPELVRVINRMRAAEAGIAELRAGIEERNRAIDSINAQRNVAEQRCAVLEETVAWQKARAVNAENRLLRVVKKERPPLVVEDDIQPADDPSIPFTGQPRHAISDFEKENTDAENR